MNNNRTYTRLLAVLFVTATTQQATIHPAGNTIASRIQTPTGFQRVTVKHGSFGEYLRQQALKADGSVVHYYNGDTKPANVHVAVLRIDIGKKNLQQCADAVMRLRAEYLYHHKRYTQIHFKFTNGFSAAYSKWAQGYRINVSGNQVSWAKAAEPSDSYESFRRYLDLVFTYAGTISLAKELKSVAFEDMQIGDVFIQGGSPGHAVIVVDMAIDSKTGTNVFMLAQSYMPAQDIHILKNPTNVGLSPWYNLNHTTILYTPEWTFEKRDLKRFID